MKTESKNYTVVMMSKALSVSSSGYYKWLKLAASKSKFDIVLKESIKKVFNDSLGTYGSPRVAQKLQDIGKLHVSASTIARRMKSLSLTARPKRKFAITTNSDHDLKVSDNLLDRQFNVATINTVWVSDITYIRVAQRWMYLTTVMDLADRMIVGWNLSNDMTTTNTINAAFKKAVKFRDIGKKSNLMFHSDRGVQYASKDFRELLNYYGCIQSMSRKGNCWDNAVAESFFKTIKVESLNRYVFKDRRMLEKVIFRYINGFYNTIRIHTSLGGKSPLMVFLMKAKKLAA